jgi:pilus assembly protein CpaB
MIKNLAIGGGSNRVLLLTALLLGLIAAILVGLYLSSLEGDNGTSSSTTSKTVVVAAVDIPPLTEITPEMLTVKSIPTDFVLLNAFTDPDRAVGETTQTTIVAGEQIIQTKLTSPESAQDVFGDDAPLSLIVPDGMRAFSIQVSAVGAAGGLIRPGDHVDIIQSGSVLSSPEQGTITPGSACYVLQNVQVLALDSSLAQTATEADAAGIAAADANADASRATLAVTPDQAWQLAGAQGSVSGGGVGTQLWLSLRPFGESAPAEGLPTCTTFAGS